MIGVFDSGIGGLGAVSVLQRRFPKEDIVYFADTAHLPYGNREVRTLLQYGTHAVRFFSRFGVRAILCACGTISATVFAPLQKEACAPLYDIIEPTARAVASIASARRRVGVIATEASIRADAYRIALQRFAPSLSVRCAPCPCFVPLIERLYDPHRPLCDLIRPCLAPFLDFQPHYLILGCTHFPLLSEAISELLPHTKLLDAGLIASQAFPPPDTPICETGRLRCFVNGDADAFLQRVNERYPNVFPSLECLCATQESANGDSFPFST